MESVTLTRGSAEVPWGFRLYGGCDYSQPLTVQKVSEGSVASEKVSAGDVIVQIGGSGDASSLTHAQAMQAIKSSGTCLQLGILRKSSPYQETSTISPHQFEHQLNLYEPTQTNGNWSQAHPPEPISPQHHLQLETAPPPPKVPDAVLNMAARGDGSKKPFAYVPDIHDIQAQREKVKKRSPGHQVIPSYQNLLSMPQFDDSPRSRGTNRLITPTSPPAVQSGAGADAVVANLQFNSPLQMYSSDNVIESLKGQTGAEIRDVVGLSKKEKSDITQSAVYKMIHGIDQPKPKPAISYVENKSSDHGGQQGPGYGQQQQQHQQQQQQQQEEYRPVMYTGQSIPSRSFRMLQDMTSGDNTPASATLKFQQQPSYPRPPQSHPRQPTGHFRPPPEPYHHHPPQQHQQYHQQQPPYSGSSSPAYGARGGYGGPRGGSMERREGSSEVDTSSIYQHLRGGGSDDYNEKSVRYVGKSIPSKCFRMLQDMTGGPRENDALPGPRRHPSSQSDAESTEDGRNRGVRYGGGQQRGGLPSQTFKMLQRQVGDSSQGSPGPARAPVVQQESVEESTDF